MLAVRREPSGHGFLYLIGWRHLLCLVQSASAFGAPSSGVQATSDVRGSRMTTLSGFRSSSRPFAMLASAIVRACLT